MIKSANDGITSQKILFDKTITSDVSLVSIYNHKIASTDTSGIDANNAPANELRLVTSEMITTNIVVKAILTM